MNPVIPQQPPWDNPGDLRTLIGRFLDRLGAKIADTSSDEADIDAELLFLDALANPIVSEDPVFLREWARIHEPPAQPVRDPDLEHRRTRFRELRAIVASLARRGTLVRLAVPDWDVPDPEGAVDIGGDGPGAGGAV